MCYRWLRQPLIDAEEINRRLDVVAALKDHTSLRLELIDGPLKNAPDLDAILSK
jgi:DNA mismatch repair ATPase MutS